MGNLDDKAILTPRECKNQRLWISWNPASEVVRSPIFTCETKIWHMFQYGYFTEKEISDSFVLLHSSISSCTLLFYILPYSVPLFSPPPPLRFQVFFLFHFPLPVSSLPQISLAFYLQHCFLVVLPLSLLYRLPACVLPLRLPWAIWRYFRVM